MSKLAKFRSRHGGASSAPKRNPPMATDVVEYLVPGFVAFALDRILTKFIAAQIERRAPKYAKHAGAIAAIGTFGAAWWGAHKVKYLEKYHHPIVIGTGLAALQSLIQLYVPKLGAFLGDPLSSSKPASSAPLIQSQAPAQLASSPPPGFRPTTANEWYTYNDSFDAGGYKGKEEGMQTPVPGQQTSEPDEMQITDLLDNSDIVDADLGSFS